MCVCIYECVEPPPKRNKYGVYLWCVCVALCGMCGCPFVICVYICVYRVCVYVAGSMTVYMGGGLYMGVYLAVCIYTGLYVVCVCGAYISCVVLHVLFVWVHP